MADWSDNNRACKTLWTTLYAMKQITSGFSESGALKMSELAYFNPFDSEDLRKQNAGMIADQLDSTFRHGRGAKFETEMDRTKVISGITALLIDADKLVSDLADLVDSMYNFYGEVKS